MTISPPGEEACTCPGTHETHLSLIERLRGPTSATAWSEFVRLYQPLLCGYVRARGVPEHDVDVVVSEVLTSLVRTLPTFQFDRRRGRFRTWLYRVTSNAVNDHFRHGRRRRAHEMPWTERTPEPAALGPGVDEAWQKCEQTEAARRALDLVRADTSAGTWACFERYLMKDHRAEAVGADLGILANTVRKNALRVLARVRDEAQVILQELAS
jgi:RNA polymerase sigma-70 factor (ECF subfamily)